MTVEQVGKKTNQVTIRISGITEGDRQTHIGIPKQILNPNADEWMTLSTAQTNGYITFVTDLNANNGDITVTFNKKYLDLGVRRAKFKVANVNTEYGGEIWITTFLKFEYANTFPKVSGEDIDITVKDLREINLFSRDISVGIGGFEYGYYPLNGVSAGDSIFAEYLSAPANNLLTATDYCPYLPSAYYTIINNYTSNIIKNCKSGAYFKADYFNEMLYAINSFNLSVSY